MKKYGMFRTVKASFWSDPKVMEEFTPEDRYFYLYLLTNPHTNLSGCYEISIKQMADELGYKKEVVESLLNRIDVMHHCARYNKETYELIIWKWGIHNWNPSEKLRAALDKIISGIKCEEYREYLKSEIDGEQSDIPYTYPMHRVSPESETSNTSTRTSPVTPNTNTNLYLFNTNISNTNTSNTKEKKEEALASSSMSDPLKEEVNKWLQYKGERKETYKPQGLNSLIKQIEKKEQEHGSAAVINLIELCMSNNWKGIIWDRLTEKKTAEQSYEEMWANI